MRKTRQMLSVLTAAAMTASAFSGLCISASAEETVQTLDPSAATYINSASADTNFSDAGELYANFVKPKGTGWESTGGDGMDVALVQFDISDYVGKITGAELTLTSTCTTATKNSEVNIAYTDADWDASTITWNTAQEMNPVKITAMGYAGDSGTALSADVGNYVMSSEDGKLSFAFYTSTGRQQKLEDIKLNLTVTDSVKTTYSIKYVDTDGEEIKDPTVKEGFADVEYTAESSDTANFYVGDDYYVFQPDLSTTSCVASADGEEVMTLVYKKLVGAVLVEDFGSITDTWGFTTTSGVELKDGALRLCVTNGSTKTDTKDLDESVSYLTAAKVSFKWKTEADLTASGGNRQSVFQLKDKNGNVIFTISGATNRSGIPTKVRYEVGGDVTTASASLADSSDWFTVDLNIDFLNNKLSGTITNGTNSVTIPETTVDAANLAQLAATNISSLAPMMIDDIIITKGDVEPVTFNVVSSKDNTPIEGAVVTVEGFTATTDAEGKAVMDMPAGTFTASVEAAQHKNNTVDVTVENDEVTVPVTMEYVGATAATKVEIEGGDAGIYKPLTGESKTVVPYTAKVYDTIDQVMPDEEIVWSIDNIATGLTGVSIDENGIVTVTEDMPIVDNNGDDLIIRAACKSNPEVYATVRLHVYNVAAVTVFDIVGPAVIKDGTTVSYSVANIKDQYGVDMTSDAVPVITSDNKDITINGTEVTPSLGVSNEVNATLTIELDGVKKTQDVIIYGYDFYEPGIGTASIGSPRMEEIAGQKMIVWPASTNSATATYSMTFPKAVELANGTSKMLTFNTYYYDMSGNNKDVTAQERTMLIKNSEGKALMTFAFQNGTIYLNPVFASGAVNSSDASWVFNSPAEKNDETIVFSTDMAGITKATVQVNGGDTYTFTVGENVGDLAEISLVEGKGAPSARLQALVNVKITNSDIVPVEISGDSYISKIYGGEATKTYTASIFSQEDGETFKWSCTPIYGEAASLAEDSQENETKYAAVLNPEKTVENAVVATVIYGDDGRIVSVTTSTKNVTAGEAVTVDAPEGAKVMLWNSLKEMEPIAEAASAKLVTEPTTEPEATPTTEPEATPTTEPEATPTTEPEATPTTEPEATPTTEPEGDIYIDDEGVLHVPYTTTATAVEIKFASNSDESKYATKIVEIRDYANVASFDIEGPAAISVGDTGTYSVSNIKDEYGDVVEMTPSYTLTEGNDIASIDAETGVLTTTGAGNVTVAVTVGNPGKTLTLTKDVTVANFYYVNTNVTENSVSVDVASLANYSADTQYYVTTAKDGNTVKQYTTAAEDGKVTVDTTGADAVEVSPIYAYDYSSSPKETVEIPLSDGSYDITVLKSNNERADVMLYGNIIMQNLDMNGSGRSGMTELTAVDLKVSGGSAVISTGGYRTNTATSYISKLTIKKAPSILTRKQHVYVLGDSLVSTYYGEPTDKDSAGVAKAGTAQTGWGQVLDKFIKSDVNVTNLAESGNYAQGLYDSVFKTVLANAEPGDVLLFECGYNDRNYPTALGSDTIRYENMKNYMELAYNEATAKGIKLVFVTPNASTHGTGWKASVQGAGHVISKCEELGAEYIDLSTKSFEYISTTKDTEDESKTYAAANFNISDNLHSTYLGAMKNAEIVAQIMSEMDSLKNLVDTNASYDLTDTEGNVIELKIR
jgi:lysophospholipase L1-like esterase